jgi:hypothetical protein
MSLDPRLWTELEACGLTNEHLAALLRFFRCEANGSFAWHVHQGRFDHCELKVSYPGKPYTVARVSQVVLVGDTDKLRA